MATPRLKGKLRIGDDWRAINIIALSQSSPLKAVAELVENSIDAGAKNVEITRGREHGKSYLRIHDDGEGIPKNADGLPDFHYVATHICDSVKRRLKEQGVEGIQGEFGIGLLSFWTLGESLTVTSCGDDGRTYEMLMIKGEQRYEIRTRRTLFPDVGTAVLVKPLLSGIRGFSGEKLQWYLSSELRDRIRRSGVRIHIKDRTARKEYDVVPREFNGRLLHELGVQRTSRGDVYLELYLDDASPDRNVGLHRSGTRVVDDIASLEAFQHVPWTSGYLEGIIDAHFVNLTPGTRSGVIRDDAFDELRRALVPIEDQLNTFIAELQRAEEERTSERMLRSIRRAFREALLALPPEEYDWFDIHKGGAARGRLRESSTDEGAIAMEESTSAESETVAEPVEQKSFFEHAGPLHSVRISPASCVVRVGESRTFRAIPRDRSGRQVEVGLAFVWDVVEGEGRVEDQHAEIATYTAPDEAGLARLRLIVTQGAQECQAEAIITIADTLMPQRESSSTRQGLPGYTFHKAPGQLWRSRYDLERDLIVINNGHRDFVHASRTRALQLRYIARLFVKELVLENFRGEPAAQLLERMLELMLYMEEHLK